MLKSFSIVSEQRSYIRPIITNKEIELIEARHPVVEVVLDNNYIPNDVVMDKTTNILLVTGPNMAGKSTYMRQLGVISIMAQIGCFVPCKSAKLPIFEKIVTGIGASDNLVSGESTFMVEMKEANNAIQNATDKSLILFDELGRGTATYDGIALAQSILEYIHDKIKAKTVFSTHYHELTTLDKKLKHLKNIHVSAVEENNEVIFLHKIEDGPVDKSYGINVASLAHLPSSLIQRANQILDYYENKKPKKEPVEQTSLFDYSTELINEDYKEIINKLESINVIEMTPIEALNTLYEMKKEYNEKK